jgi:hypothetical protein
MIDISTLNIITGIPSNTYFVDPTNYFVYSRKGGTQSRLYGSVNISNVRSYTLQTTLRNPVKIREDRLRQAVRQVVSGAVPTVNSTNTGETNSRGWIIGSVDGNQFSFSTTPRVHDTENSVNTEIERLAKANPGRRFVKVKIEAYVQAGGVNWS